MDYVRDVPLDCWLLIFKQLAVADLLALRQLCLRFHAITMKMLNNKQIASTLKAQPRSICPFQHLTLQWERDNFFPVADKLAIVKVLTISERHEWLSVTITNSMSEMVNLQSINFGWAKNVDYSKLVKLPLLTCLQGRFSHAFDAFLEFTSRLTELSLEAVDGTLDLNLLQHHPLTKLSLSGYPAKQLPVLPHLEHLIIDFNGCSIFGLQLPQQTRLTTLKLIHSYDVDWTNCTRSLRSLTMLQSVQFRMLDLNSLSHLEDLTVCGIYVNCMGFNLSTLKRLEIQSDDFDQLPAQPELQELTLIGGEHPDDELILTPNVLNNYINLRRLILASLTLDVTFLQLPLVEYLAMKDIDGEIAAALPSLTELKVERCNIRLTEHNLTKVTVLDDSYRCKILTPERLSHYIVNGVLVDCDLYPQLQYVECDNWQSLTLPSDVVRCPYQAK